jgi:NADH:ubiquinone oxidoreductase subunit H
MVIFLSYLCILFFVGGCYLFLLSLLLVCFFIWVRGSFPRFRSDKLMGVS